MISRNITDAHFPVLREAVHQLDEFSERALEPGPYHHSFLRTISNSVLPLLGMTMVLSAGGNFRAECKVTKASFDFEIPDDEIWGHVMDLVHRSFYSTLAIAVEAMCKGFCEARGGGVSASRPLHMPEFMDYINSALKASALPDGRKNHWRNYFEAIRTLRNKCAHYNTLFTEHEIDVVRRAGLDQHIGATGHMQSNPANYAPLANAALDFIRELEPN